MRKWFKRVIVSNKVPKNYDNKKMVIRLQNAKNILDKAVIESKLKPDTPTELLTHIIIPELYGMMTI